MWMPIDLRKGEDDHCWMKASHCLSNPSEPPLRPSYWLFKVATTSLHISCINIIGCAVWLEKSRLHRCFHRLQRVIGLTNSNTTWDFTLIGVEWILSMVGKKLLCFYHQHHPLFLMIVPVMITNIHFPTWLCLAPSIIAIGGQPPAIFDGSQGSHKVCIRIMLLHLGTLHN